MTEQNFLIVLCNDFSYDINIVGEGTMARCMRSVVHARHLLRQDMSVTIICATGSDAKMQPDMTKAEHMWSEIEPFELPVNHIVNTEDYNVSSTILELRWAFERIAESGVSNPVIQVVTNVRHGVRTKIIARWFCGKKVDVVESIEVTPLWHEFFGYAKLLVHMIGLGGVIEKLRRRYYHG